MSVYKVQCSKCSETIDVGYRYYFGTREQPPEEDVSTDHACCDSFTQEEETEFNHRLSAAINADYENGGKEWLR